MCHHTGVSGSSSLGVLYREMGEEGKEGEEGEGRRERGEGRGEEGGGKKDT